MPCPKCNHPIVKAVDQRIKRVVDLDVDMMIYLVAYRNPNEMPKAEPICMVPHDTVCERYQRQDAAS